ncbi:MAG: 3'(2'),5'-bisphosphate nucleotidase CysQ [Acidimicrobiales bacterium]|nr:3'(2'),5'-bisphosphate nucleotidase CysQ [Acidimicrobiales bacterium]
MTQPSDDPTDSDHALARRLAVEAGVLLVETRRELATSGVDATVVKDEGDRRSNEFLLAELAAHVREDDGVLSEESRATHGDERRLTTSRVWIIDPLDGTREFSEPPRTDWAVHVALCIDGEPVCGAVSLPALGTCFSTADDPLELPPIPDAPRVVVSRTRPPAEADTVRQALGGTLVEMGSAGAKTMAILRGEVDCYPHSGGQYEWDSAAPAAVARHHGLHVSRLDGSPLRYNNADPYLPDLLVCRRELAGASLRALGA